MNDIWLELKAYFSDGYIANSSPMGFRVHCCHLTPSRTPNKSTFYGVEINEETMPLFSALGDTCAPPCTCGGAEELCKHIENILQASPTTSIKDYSLHTGKGDASVYEACLYAMRDAIQWWAIWHGSLDNNFWKHLYVAISTITDDVLIPPQHLIDGSFRFLGHSLSDVLAGLRSENVHPDDIKFMEQCLLRQYILQYLEKTNPGLRDKLLSNMTLMTQFRTLTGNPHGSAVALLAARETKSLGAADTAVEMASICNALSLDIAKEALGILQGEKTETVAGNRKQLKRELRWLFARSVECLDSHPSAHLLRRFATSGLIFVPIMDRYRERVTNTRFQLSAPLRRRLDSYVVKRPASTVSRMSS